MPIRSTDRPTGGHLRVVGPPPGRPPVHPLARRVTAAALVAALASGVVLLLGRLGGGAGDWPAALALFALLFGAQLVGPGPQRSPRRR